MSNDQSSSQPNISIPLAIIAAGFLIALGLAVSNWSGSQQAPSEAALGETTQPQEETSPEAADNQPVKVTDQDHIRGNPEAPVTIVEFSDFQCSFCQRFHSTVQQALDDYPDKVRWVYKHFPLGFHEQAKPAAEASECVAEQAGDKGFWQFADGLFANQSRLGKDLYQELAGEIGIDLSQFNNCLNSGKFKDKVEADYQQGVEAGVSGTPGSFVNGRMISGAQPYSALKASIESALSDL